MLSASNRLRVAAAQIRVTDDLSQNLETILGVLEREAQQSDLVLFPETALSGYGATLDHLRAPDEWSTIQTALHTVADAAHVTVCGWHLVATCGSKLPGFTGCWSIPPRVCSSRTMTRCI